MQIIFAIILGAVQGLTEFFPVSSSGHLVLLNKIFGIQGDFLFLSIILHVATLFAVAIVLRKELWYLLKNPFSPLMGKLALSTFVTLAVVLLFKSVFIESFNGKYLAICFMTTAVILVVTEFVAKRAKNALNAKTAIIMGLAQGIAIFPGISRSGATICSGLLAGAEREETTKFSFLMSIPIILGSMAYEIFEVVSGGAVVETNWLAVACGFMSAFVFGVLAVKLMLKYMKKGKLWWFAIYLIAISVLCLCIL